MWCPLLPTHSRKFFCKFCVTLCSMVGEIATTSSLVFCSKCTVVFGFFSYTLLLSYPQSKKSQALWSAILQVIQYSLFVRSPLLGTSRCGLALQSSQCETESSLTDTTEFGLQHQVPATSLTEMCEASQHTWLNLLLLPCLSRLQRNRGRSPQKCYTTPNSKLLRM